MEDLKQLIERYGNMKGEMDSYNKQVDADNKAIKQVIVTEGEKVTLPDGRVKYKAEGGGYEATYSIAISESFDEAKLIKKLNSLTFISENGCKVLASTGLNLIKMQPTVDMDALENAIYAGKIKAEDLQDCIVRKETPKLTISKIKE